MKAIVRTLLGLAMSCLAATGGAQAKTFDLAKYSAGGTTESIELELADNLPVRRSTSHRLPPEIPISSADRTRAWTVDGKVGVVSDYRPGGISSTAGKPAIQAEIEIVHRSGIFASGFASSLAPNGGDRVELDLSAGMTRAFKRTTLTLLGTAYIFPGVGHSLYGEIEFGAERKFGRATLGASVAWCLPQANLRHRGNLYLGVDGSVGVKGTPLVVDAAFGREEGAFGNRKLNWSIGGHIEVHHVELSLAYQDARRTGHAAHSGATLVSGIALTF